MHRPKYDDWSFPKGKLDRGEHATTAAVREVAEETGLHVRLGPPLSEQRYPVGAADEDRPLLDRAPGGRRRRDGYLVNEEIDDVVWVSHDEAVERLTYPRDVETLHEASPRGSAPWP